MLLPLARGLANFDNHVKTISEAVGLSPPELPVLNRPLMTWLPRTSTPSQKMSALSLHVYTRLKQMQPLSLAAPARQALGTYWDIAMAPQPLGPPGPMAWCRRTTTETPGVDSILSQAERMNMRKVPSYYGSCVNNTTLGLRWVAAKLQIMMYGSTSSTSTRDWWTGRHEMTNLDDQTQRKEHHHTSTAAKEGGTVEQATIRLNVQVIRSQFGSSHFLFKRARCFFPFTSLPGLVLSKCLQPSFVVSHPLSWHV